MAKQRNTKVSRRRTRRQPKLVRADSPLSAEEQNVMDLFREYRMAPGKMLCLSSADLQAFGAPLAELTRRGLLVAERFPGGFSLTESGFTAMRKWT